MQALSPTRVRRVQRLICLRRAKEKEKERERWREREKEKLESTSQDEEVRCYALVSRNHSGEDREDRLIVAIDGSG